MKIDGAELEKRKKFLTITDDDIILLQSIHEKAPQIFDRIADVFIRHLFSFEETKASLAPFNPEEIKKRVAAYFGRLFEGKYDFDYLLNSIQIGYTHNAAGIDTKYFIGAYGESINAVMPFLQELSGQDMALFSKAVSAFFKVVLFDIANTMEAYFYEKQASIRCLNRLYSVLSKINEFMIRVNDINELLEGICPIFVDDGEFKFAWVGLTDRAAGEVRPVTLWGEGEAYVRSRKFSLRPDPSGSPGPTETAITEARIVAGNDIETDGNMVPWQRGALNFGFKSYAAMPIKVSGEIIGAITVYDVSSCTFEREHMHLLGEIAGDISFAMENIGKLQKTKYVSLFDSLTDLPNRNHILQELQSILDNAGSSGRRIAFIVMDIDRFKVINETIGYTGGDELLKKIAATLSGSVKGKNMLGRIGADEFAVICPDIADEEDIYKVIEGLNTPFSKPVELNGTQSNIAFSLGIALYPNDGDNAEDLVKIAEASLAQAQKTGAKSQGTYSPAINKRLSEMMKIRNRLLRALDNKEFRVYYEPKVDIKTFAISGMEALLRWHDPEEGVIQPARIIPILEETGMILKVGQWVLQEASNEAKRWNEKGYNLKVAVNVSAVQLEQEDFARTIIMTTMDQGLNPANLEIEITESLLMKNVEKNIDKLLQLKDYGIAISIDDFGTGYSSLAYLKRLPVNSLKIDISFIKSLPEDKENAKITETIISLARTLNLRTIAEGIDSREQMTFLGKLGCDEVQGYYFTKPQPAHDIERFIADFPRKYTGRA